jgi:hypothetical protein
MSQPTVAILFSSTTPPAPTGDQNVKPQTDGAVPQQSISFYPQKATSSLRGTVKPDGVTTSVDGSGVISAVQPSGAANEVLATPDGSSGTATVRALVAADIPSLPESQVTGLVADLAAKASISGVQQESYTYAADTGTANAYAVTLSPAPTLVAGSAGSFKAANACTGPSTLAINGGTPIAIKKNGNSIALASGDIAVNQIIDWTYDGTAIQILVPGSGGGGAVSSLTTTGTSGAATLVSGVLNIPQYSGGGGGGTGFGGGEAALTAPVLSAFAQTNFGTTGTSTVAESFSAGGVSGIRLRERGAGGNTNTLRSLLQALPTSGPWTVTARLRSQTLMTTWQGLGLVLEDSVSGKFLFYGWAHDFGPLAYITWASVTSYGGATNVPADYVDYDAWFQIHYDGTNLNFQYSRDGNYFVTLKQTTPTAYLTNAANKAGIGINPNCSGNGLQETVLECFSFTIVNS